MEEQAVNNQLHQPPINQVSPKPCAGWDLAKSNYCIIAGIILILFLIFATIYVRSLPSRKPISPSSTSPHSISPTPSPATDETANWKTYISSDNLSRFRYPNTWENFVMKSRNDIEVNGKKYQATTIEFGLPISEEERKKFGYLKFEDTPRTYREVEYTYATHPDFENINIEDIHRELTLEGIKKPTLLEWIDPKWKDITIGDNIRAKRVFHSACQSGSCLVIFFKVNDTIFDFYLANSDEESSNQLDQILSTFKFTDKEEQVVCTQEAKLCPDGKTYVGRQGPKCEFVPCP